MTSGDLVSLTVGTKKFWGVVEKREGEWIWVRWEDGKIGILSFEREGVAYDANQLVLEQERA